MTIRSAKRRGALAALALALTSFGCGARPARPGSAGAPPSAPPPAAGSGVRVTLAWTAPVDLDLYVTDPAAVTVYFANTPTARGRLVNDAGCGSTPDAGGARLETVVFPAPPPGVYRVGIDYIDACRARVAPVAWRIVVEGLPERIDATGVAEPDRLAPVALEFQVAPGTVPTATPPPKGRKR